MKRGIACLVLTALFFFALSSAAYAADTSTYTLDELDMSVSLPSDYIVLTRDTDADDPNLAAYGLTKDDLSLLMSASSIYLNAWSEDLGSEIVITMMPDLSGDYNLYSDTTLSVLMTSLEAEYEAAGVTLSKSEIYQHAQAKFVKIYSSLPSDGTTVYILQYHTVYANRGINITLRTSTGQISSSHETALKSIVDSISFGTAPQHPDATPVAADAFIYTDTETGASFTVPANWLEQAFSEDRGYLDVKFASTIEEGLIIFYGGVDTWGQMSETERTGYTRSDVNNAVFSKADVAEMYSIPVSQVETVTYGGYDYYKAELVSTGSSHGLEVTVTMTQLFRMDNGYMYSFQFSGTSDNPFYADFEQLLESVDYPQVSDTPPDTPAIGQSTAESSTGFDIGGLLLNLLLTIAIYSLPIIVYRYAIRKAPVQPKTARIITIIYGIAAFVIMSMLVYSLNGKGASGSAILLWSYINYRMLKGGRKSATEAAPSAAPGIAPAEAHEGEEQQPPITERNDAVFINSVKDGGAGAASDNTKEAPDCRHDDEIHYCHKCGNRLEPDSAFCNKCGAKIPATDKGEK